MIGAINTILRPLENNNKDRLLKEPIMSVRKIQNDIFNGLKKGVIFNHPRIDCKEFPKATLSLDSFPDKYGFGKPQFRISLWFDKEPEELHGVEVYEVEGKKLYRRNLDVIIT